MKITVVDTVDFSLDQLDRLRALGDIDFYDDVPSREELFKRLEHTDIAILGWSNMDKEAFKAAKNLRLLSLWSTGFDYVDITAAKAKGVSVSNVPAYASETIAELTITLAVMVSRSIIAAHTHVVNGGYNWKSFRGSQLYEKTLGIIGLGDIGAAVAKRAQCFGMKVISYTANPSNERSEELGVEFVTKSELFSRADVISLHCALNRETEKIVGANEFKTMKTSAFLVNTARAELIDEEALVGALRAREIAGAGLDVISEDSRGKGSYLLTDDRIVLTPHFAFNTHEAIERKTEICLQNVIAFLEGKPTNLII
ncbi:MAG: NAD(P)-dependent oxidoreductase [Pseudomonadota bacterium]